MDIVLRWKGSMPRPLALVNRDAVGRAARYSFALPQIFSR